MSKDVSIVIGVEVVTNVDDKTFDALKALAPTGERASREVISSMEEFSWLDELLDKVGDAGVQTWVKSVRPLTQ